jgi:hypothetical protein
VVLVANPGAFESRYGSGLPVAGTYTGRFDNGGERIQVLDPSGEEILDFRYTDWFPEADGGGFSMGIVDVNGEPDSWGDKSQWRPSSSRDGTPGGAPAEILVARPGQGAEILLRFVATPNLRHELQRNDSLDNGGWQTLVTVPPSATERVVEHSEKPDRSSQFFRVISSQGP